LAGRIDQLPRCWVFIGANFLDFAVLSRPVQLRHEVHGKQSGRWYRKPQIQRALGKISSSCNGEKMKSYSDFSRQLIDETGSQVKKSMLCSQCDELGETTPN